MLRPSESKHTSSPSITAFCTFNLARFSLSALNDLYAFRLRETSSQLPSQMCASALNPSCFNSKRKSGSSNGVRTRLSWAVSKRGGRILRTAKSLPKLSLGHRHQEQHGCCDRGGIEYGVSRRVDKVS